MVAIITVVVETVLLFTLFLQDAYRREISVIPLLALLPLTGYISLQHVPLSVFIIHSITNMVLGTLISAILFLYFRVRYPEKRFFENIMGLGDVLFLFVPCLIFSPFNFLLFVVLSSLLAILVCGIARTKTIPFAGIQSLCLVPIVLFFVEQSHSGQIMGALSWR